MSELIEIKAELLKWCHSGFALYFDGNMYYKRFHAVDGYHIKGLTVENTFVKNYETISVFPKYYEQAAIERIREMLKTEYTSFQKITKREGIVRVFLEEWKREDEDILSGGPLVVSCNVVRVKCDPRPHEETYTIYLQEEDNE
jgi:hypothetical protein